jgi:4-amino-4-deoxy-L-arabinose transferase-like glycosyltransferase
MRIPKITFEKIELVIAFAFIIAIYFTGIDRVEFDKDETHWIAYSNHFEMFFQGDFKNSRWSTEWNRYINPVITYYVIGVGRNLGGFGVDKINIPYDFTQNMKANMAAGAIPSPTLMWWSRAGVTFTSVIGLMIVFWLLLQAFGRVSAYLWLVFISINKFILMTLRQAMNEGPMFFFVMLTILAVYFFLKTSDGGDFRKQWKKLLGWLVIAALGVGFTTQTKTNGGALLFGIILALLLVLIRLRTNWPAKIAFAVISLSILGGVSFMAFILPNPTAWENPVQYSQNVIQARFDMIQNQSDDDPGRIINSWSQRLELIPQRVFVEYMEIPSIFPTFLFFLIGAIAITRSMYLWTLNQNNNYALVTLASVGLLVSIPSLFTPLDWGRYYFLPVFFFAIPVMVGIQEFVSLVISQTKNSRAVASQ